VSTTTPSAAWRSPPVSQQRLQPRKQLPLRRRRSLLLPLMAICAAQAALSLTLVWSNTAFGDEADYLWIGHLEVAHWLHGTSWPAAYADQALSGSPVIYPPLGALADSIGGLAGARILSLAFMLGATILLYLTASRLLGRSGGAIAATALWALSEPALRLAFATYDPLSVFLTALSAWLIMLAYRRGSAFVVAAAAALALANATAYSGIVIDPVIIVFAFLLWVHRMRARQAAMRTACLCGCLAVFFYLLMTASRSWTGIMSTVINRAVVDRQSILLVLNDAWGYSGLVTCLALIGATIAVRAESRQRAALLALLGCAVLVVPAAQLRERTGVALDKHLAYGIWLGAIAGGYAFSKLIEWLPGASRKLTAVCCIIALSYLAVNSWQSAWRAYHSWANSRAFITAFTPVAAQSHGLIYASGQEHIAEYYTPQGLSWTRWNTTLSLNPVSLPEKAWSSYYHAQLNNGKYGIIVLFYSTTFSPASLKPDMLLPQNADSTYRRLLDLVGQNSEEQGIATLTQALATDTHYQLVTHGPFNSAHEYGSYAIWRKVQN
jgi:hypothetical protein